METSVKVQPHSNIRLELHCGPCNLRTVIDVPVGWAGTAGNNFLDCPKCNRRYVTNLSALRTLKAHEVKTIVQDVPQDRQVAFFCPNCSNGYVTTSITAKEMSNHKPVSAQCKLCSHKFSVQAEQTATVAVWEE
jgi:transcription elongation factor Elf1